MKVAVLGLWHLGSVTAACSASAGHEVIGWDPDAATVSGLAEARPPVSEPGLTELLAEGIASRHLRFTPDLAEAVTEADVVWIAFDTPVDDEDRADVDGVVSHVSAAFPHLKDHAIVLSSSQLPVGSIARLEKAWARVSGGRRVSFACSPENLRLGKAIEVFTKPDRVVLGVRSEDDRVRLATLFAPITDRIEWMSVESAEMTKHAINAFLATSVTFINEIAALCEQSGADAKEVERGLKTEKRIGPQAYLGPGAAFAGGTLARDVVFLKALGQAAGRATPLMDGVESSNREHRGWARRRLLSLLGPLGGRTIAVWGLTYKPGTDTLRRSTAVELCRWLVRAGRAGARARSGGEGAAGGSAGGDSRVGPGRSGRGRGRAGRGHRVARVSPGEPRRAGDGHGRPPCRRRQSVPWRDRGRRRPVYDGLGGRRFPAPGSRLPTLTMPSSLAGRSALITGANQGLGLAIARAYVQAGASVMLCARDEALLLKARDEVAALAGPAQRVEAMRADVSSMADVEALVSATVERLGGLHVLVNNAGVYGPMGADRRRRLGRVGARDRDQPVRVGAADARGAAALQGASATARSCSSPAAARRNPLPRISAYAASKAAIVRLAETLALDVKDLGIDVNAIAPGALNTRLLDKLLAAGAGARRRGLLRARMKQKAEGGRRRSSGARRWPSSSDRRRATASRAS